MASRCANLRSKGPAGEQPAHVLLAAQSAGGEANAGRRRVAADRFSSSPIALSGVQLTTTIRRRGGDTHELRGRCVVARRERTSKAGTARGRSAPPERQFLGVTFDPIDVQAVLGGATARRLEQLVCEVEADDLGVRAAARRATLPVPVATSSTSCPRRTSALAMRSWDGASSIISATAEWFPAAQVARWTRLRSATVGIGWIFLTARFKVLVCPRRSLAQPLPRGFLPGVSARSTLQS